MSQEKDISSQPSEESTTPLPTKQPMSRTLLFSAGAFMVMMVILLLYVLNRETYVQSVRIEGAQLSSQEQIQQLLQSNVGKHADSLAVEQILLSLQALPYVAEAELYVETRGELVISLREWQPLAQLVGDGPQGLFAEQGLILPQPQVFVDLPLLHGFKAAKHTVDTLKTMEAKALSEFLSALQSNDFANASISEVVYETNKGVVALTNDNGVKVSFGHDNFHPKLRNWKAFNQQIVKYRSLKAFSEIDLRFTNQIITREV